MNGTLTSDPFNVIITGVGGQGNVMASRVLASMLIGRGFRVTIGETFGMSQRGGSVMSHIRVSSGGVWSPQIPEGRADLVVALEPVEALRVLARYGNPQVRVLLNLRPIFPVGVITGEADYPAPDALRAAVSAVAASAFFLEATEIAIALGNPILGNIVMIGAVAGLGILHVDGDDFAAALPAGMPDPRREANMKAFAIGAAAVAAAAA